MGLRLVVVTVPVDTGCTGRARVQAQRAGARAALEESARRAELAGPPFETDAAGAPRPSAGRHWSVSHTTGLAAAVAAPCPVGIDVEWLGRRRLEALLERLGAAERRLLGTPDPFRVLRLWTAKEAVLKLTGAGISGLPDCRVIANPHYGCLGIAFGEREFEVRQEMVGDHELSVACAAPGGFELELCELAEACR